MMRVRIQPESDIEIELVDRKGKPTANARISPGSVYFRRSA